MTADRTSATPTVHSVIDGLPAAAWVRTRHDHWCDVLERWFTVNGLALPPRPGLRLRTRCGRAAGMYHSEPARCTIFLAYVMLHPTKTDDTIAHECCHHYARHALRGSQWHGDLFLFMLRVVCGFKDARSRHRMNVREAKELGEALYALEKLRPAWARAEL